MTTLIAENLSDEELAQMALATSREMIHRGLTRNVPIQIRVSSATLRRLDDLAVRLKGTRSSACRAAIDAGLVTLE